MDEIHIRNLRLRTRVGVRDWEQERDQDVVINVTMGLDLSKPAESDQLADTADYKQVKDQIVALMDQGPFDLIEHLAGRIADIAMAMDRVEQVEVTVDKPHALRFSDSVAVTIRRP
ncbi:MAG: dihydroneopterin aldolase [Candidatus Thermoplasmatota archaeon]|nr:dihydroneopterin aldolase [Candidatus Thermoplasmatota archaeon]